MSRNVHRKQVFISHAGADKPLAYQVCELLEDRNVTCWIAPRDIPAGCTYAGEIAVALDEATAVVLVMTDDANKSPGVANELSMSFARGKVIIPIRLREVSPTKDIEFFVSKAQWVDAFASPLKKRLDHVANIITAIQNQLPMPAIPKEAPTVFDRLERTMERVLRHKVLSMFVGFMVLASLSGAGIWVTKSSQKSVEVAAAKMVDAGEKVEQTAKIVQEAGQDLKEASDTVKAMDGKISGLDSKLATVKQETSSDPRKELNNRGIPWNVTSFGDAIRRADAAVIKLFLDGGMQLNMTDSSSRFPPTAYLIPMPEDGRNQMLQLMAPMRDSLGISWQSNSNGYRFNDCLPVSCFGWSSVAQCAREFPRLGLWQKLVSLGVQPDAACRETMGEMLVAIENDRAKNSQDSMKIKILRGWGVQNSHSYKAAKE
jgi:hypothetical protein